MRAPLLALLVAATAEAAAQPAPPPAPVAPPPPPPLDGFQLPTAELAFLESLIEEADDIDGLRDALRGRFARLRCPPIEQQLGPLTAQVQGWARELDRDVEVVVTGGELRLPAAVAQPVLTLLPPILRNAVEHGVEPRGERADKPARAPLTLTFAETGERWEISVADDGAGLDTRKLRSRATELGLLDRKADPRHDEVCALIFAPKLTTVDGAPKRGAGLAAVAEAVRGLGGTARVSSEPGFGTTIHLELPKPAAAPDAG